MLTFLVLPLLSGVNTIPAIHMDAEGQNVLIFPSLMQNKFLR